VTAPATHEEAAQDKDCAVVINGTLFTLESDTVTYEQLCQLAYPNHDPQAMFTVTYQHADTPHGGKGTLVAGETVKVKKKGTTFSVRLTTRS
jgi:hypothetical protein